MIKITHNMQRLQNLQSIRKLISSTPLYKSSKRTFFNIPKNNATKYFYTYPSYNFIEKIKQPEKDYKNITNKSENEDKNESTQENPTNIDKSKKY